MPPVLCQLHTTYSHNVIGDCFDCIGESDDALNSCRFEDPSCISVASDDEAHFYAPWTFDGDRAAAVQQLLDMATGTDSFYCFGGSANFFGDTH